MTALVANTLWFGKLTFTNFKYPHDYCSRKNQPDA